jgi:hypothetical protein
LFVWHKVRNESTKSEQRIIESILWIITRLANQHKIHKIVIKQNKIYNISIGFLKNLLAQHLWSKLYNLDRNRFVKFVFCLEFWRNKTRTHHYICANTWHIERMKHTIGEKVRFCRREQLRTQTSRYKILKFKVR